MIAFLLIVYTAIIVVLFKLKLMKPKPVPIAGCVVAGILILGTVIVTWFLSAPMSSRVVTVQPVVTLVPYVKGQVLKIHAVGSQPVKKGDLLLEINPEPYQFTVNQVTAQLKSAKDNVKQSEAGLQAAKASVAKAVASVAQARAGIAEAKAKDNLARTEEMIALKLQKSDAGAISELKVVEAIQKRQANDAALKQAEAGLDVALASADQAEAAERQAGFTLEMAKNNVTAVEAQLDNATFNLRECKMYAPGDGYVVNWGVQEGVMILSGPMAPAGTFIITNQTIVAAAFPQNHLANVKPGDDVELVLDPYPGRLFKAKVDVVIPATGEGQYSASGQIPYAAKVGSQGMLVVKIRIIDDDPSLQLPLGAGGAVAIYTDSGKSVHIISKVAIRMTAPDAGGVFSRCWSRSPAREPPVVSARGSPAHPRRTRYVRGLFVRPIGSLPDPSPRPWSPAAGGSIQELCPSTRAILARLSAIPHAPFGGGPHPLTSLSGVERFPNSSAPHRVRPLHLAYRYSAH